MRDLYYSALDIAAILSSLDLGIQEDMKLIDKIWQYDNRFLLPQYRKTSRKLILDAFYWTHYFYNKPLIDREFPAIREEVVLSGGTLAVNEYICEDTDLDLFFKSLRIRILYSGGQDYVRIKLRTLLNRYGYKRRSRRFVRKSNRCLKFYRIRPYLRGGAPCNLAEIRLDDMITFRVV